MKAALLYLVCILLMALLGLGYFTHIFIEENKNLKNQIVLEQEKTKAHVLYDECINCMSRTLIVVYGLSKWEAHYYSIIFYDFSKHHNIPWEIYPAVIRIESNFISNIGSNKGAKGVMQMLEKTGKEVSDSLGIRYICNQTLWNTLTNLVLGCEYLSTNIQKKGMQVGVKSYLGGPMSSKRPKKIKK